MYKVDDSEDLDSIDSDLTSLSSSIFNYTYENGRTYHAFRSGSYVRFLSWAPGNGLVLIIVQVLPNDEAEQDRLDLLHHIFRLCLHGELCRTKLSNPQKILDIGTGTGIWAIEGKT